MKKLMYFQVMVLFCFINLTAHADIEKARDPVSYTHLTLPTKA